MVKVSWTIGPEVDGGEVVNEPTVDEVTADDPTVDKEAVGEPAVNEMVGLVKSCVTPDSTVNFDQTHLASVSITKAVAYTTSYPSKKVCTFSQ